MTSPLLLNNINYALTVSELTTMRKDHTFPLSVFQKKCALTHFSSSLHLWESEFCHVRKERPGVESTFGALSDLLSKYVEGGNI